MDTILNLIPIIGGVIAFCALWWKMATSVATKSDIATMKTELREDIASVRTELKSEIADVKAELKADIDKLRTEVKEDITEVRADIREIRQFIFKYPPDNDEDR